MNFRILIFFLLLLIVQNINTIHAENEESNSEKAPIEEFGSTSGSKIHPTLVKWQTSENPDEFAEENNLSVNKNKVAVYIHLESAESRSQIPPEINVMAFDEKIALAFVSPEQLDELDNLDFVERVTPPDLVRFFPLPQGETPETQTLEENRYDYLVWIAIGGIVIFTIIAILKKRQKLHNQNKD